MNYKRKDVEVKDNSKLEIPQQLSSSVARCVQGRNSIRLTR